MTQHARFRAPLLALALSLLVIPGCKSSRPGGERHEQHGLQAPSGQAEVPEPAGASRLVVLVVVDQLPSWWFGTVTELLTGGVGRMLREGVYYPEAHIPYAISYTAPGHVALGTGAPPAVTGILSNDWYQRDLGRRVTAAEDPDSPEHLMVHASRDAAGGGISGVRLRVAGIADVLEQATEGRSKTVAISLKERSAALTLGRRPDLAVWYAPGQPAMTTSRYYAPEPPAWLRAWNETQPVSRYFDEVWTPLEGVDHAAQTGGPDDAPGEGGFHGLNDRFPHRMADTSDPAKAVQSMPAGDLLVFDAARAALAGEAMGQDPVPDLLSLSFSAQDYAGHVWGQESWERLDMFLRLDQALGAFLDELDERVGRDRYAVVLTSDHGAARMVERVRAASQPARRIPAREIEEAARQAAARVLGKGEWIAALSTPTVYMSKDFDALDQERKDAALDAVVAAFEGIEGMAYAARTDRITGGCDAREGIEALACWSLIPGESGDVFFAPGPNHPITGIPSGTNHGSAAPDDCIVPVLVYAPGSDRWAAPRVVREPVSLFQVAPTLAQLLGVPPPPAATAAPLP